MSRTPEISMILAKAGCVPLTAREDRTLADEVERLEARVTELEASVVEISKIMRFADLAAIDYVRQILDLREQNARLRAALVELKRNTIEVILPHAKNITLDLGQVALWDECVRQTEAALAETKGTP